MSIGVDVLHIGDAQAIGITVRGDGKREDERIVIPWEDVGELYQAITEALAAYGDGAIRVTGFDACYFRALARARRQSVGRQGQGQCPPGE